MNDKKKVKAKDAPVNIEVASKSFVDSAKKSIGEILSEQFEIGLNPTEIKSLVDDWNKKIADGEYTVTDVRDTDGYNKLVRARALFRTTRTAIDKKRKELKAVPNEMGKAIDSYAKGLTELVEPIELLLDKEVERIDAEKERVKIEKEKAEQQFMDSRIKQLIDVGCEFDGSEYTLGEFSTFTYDIRTANDEEFVALVGSAKVEALKLAEKKSEQEKILREEDERRARELRDIEFGKEMQRKAEEKLRLEKEEFERKQKEELEKFFREKQELEKQKQELIRAKSEARAQQLVAIGYQLDNGDFVFRNKYNFSHYVRANCFVLDDSEWAKLIEEAIVRKENLLTIERERDEKEEKNRKENQERIIAEQRTKERIAQLEAEGFVEGEGGGYYYDDISVVITFITHSEPADWNKWFFEKKSAIDFQKQQAEEKTKIELMSDSEKITSWADSVLAETNAIDVVIIKNNAVRNSFIEARAEIWNALGMLRQKIDAVNVS